MEKTRFLDRHSPPHIGTLVLITGTAALNMNIILPSLPGIAAYFQVSYSFAQLMISAYLAGTALIQIIIGPLSDRYGRRPVILTSLVIFLFATILCIFAPNFETLFIGRMLQTFVVSGIVLARAVVRDMVPTDKAASLLGYVTMGMALVPMIGPVIGGVLDEIYGWRSAFVLSFVWSGLVFAIAYFDMGETNRSPSESFAAQFRAYPELVRSRRFWGYALAAAFSSGAFFAFLGGGPYVAAEVFGLTPSQLGIYFGITGLGYILGNFLSGRFATRVGINVMILIGSNVVAGGMLVSIAVYALGYTHPAVFFSFMIFVGVGNGLTLPSANAGIVSVRPHLAGSASGLGGALMIGGGAGLSVLAGATLGPQTGPYPLLFVMLGSAIAGSCAALYVIHVANQVARKGQ